MPANAGDLIEGARRCEMEIIEPDQNRALLSDMLEDAHDDRETNLRIVEDEALSRRSERNLRARRRRAKPLRGRGDPGEARVVFRIHVPALHQGLLDERSIRALE